LDAGCHTAPRFCDQDPVTNDALAEALPIPYEEVVRPYPAKHAVVFTSRLRHHPTYVWIKLTPYPLASVQFHPRLICQISINPGPLQAVERSIAMMSATTPSILLPDWHEARSLWPGNKGAVHTADDQKDPKTSRSKPDLYSVMFQSGSDAPNWYAVPLKRENSSFLDSLPQMRELRSKLQRKDSTEFIRSR
jgi:hypothetical protein